MGATISICIPCYKSERYVRTTIESALAQTVPAAEILVSDDHSPDRTSEILNEYRDIPLVRITRPPHRLTLGEHYRFLLEEATGDYICFLSHDDALMPSFLETMQSRLEEGVSLVAAACLECSRKLVPRRVRGITLPTQTFHPPGGYLHFRNGNGYTISVSLMSRQALLQVPRLPPQADLATDWYWAMMLGLAGKVRFVRKPLGYYRIHESNAGHDNTSGWLHACVALLEFMKSNLKTEYKEDIEERLARVRETLALFESGNHKTAAKVPPSKILKNFTKDVIAIRYRILPRPISSAERGIGIALERARRV